MNGLNLLRAGAMAAALLVCAMTPASAQNTVRPEVGKPLQAADALFKAKKYREALAKVGDAEAAAGKTAYETVLIQRTRGSISAAAGDHAGAAKAFEAVIASDKTTGADRLKLVQAVAGLHYLARDYAKSAQWAARYQKEGGSDPAMQTLLVQSHFLLNDCAGVSRAVGEGNARRPAEQELQMLANCFNRQKDSTGYVAAIERLVTYYPKKEYWTDLLNRVQKKSGFSDRLSLDVYRLKLATGNLTTANDYLEMAQLAIQAGFPSEAKAIVDKGYDGKILGAGKDGERHQRLRDLVSKRVAETAQARAQLEKDATAEKSGDALVALGYSLVSEGATQKGIATLEQGIKKGGLKHADHAKLLLGIAQVQGGARARGLQTLKGVGGKDGTADLARPWILLGQRS